MEILLVSMMLLNTALCLETISLSKQKTRVNVLDPIPAAPIDSAEQKRFDTGKQFRAVCSNLATEYQLTSREGEVLLCLAKGYNCQSIADQLCVSISTVKSHSYRIYRKMNIHSQQEIISLVESDFKQTNYCLEEHANNSVEDARCA